MSESPLGPGEPISRAELNGIDESEVRDELERVIASPLFHPGEQPVSLLRFIVDCTLKGGEPPKEYTLAVEALGRGPEFDPRNSTIVRVQVRKLRAKLARYYETLGVSDPVVIDVPVGLYVARFRKNAPIETPAVLLPAPAIEQRPQHRMPAHVMAVIVVLAISLAALVGWRISRAAPIRIEALQLTRLTPDRNLFLAPALSADGNKLVYAADGDNGFLDLWLQDTAGGPPARLTFGSMNHQEPIISPDGKRIVFRSDGPNAGLWEMKVGSSTPPARFSKDGCEPRFSLDGRRVTFWTPAIPNAPDGPLSGLFFAPHTSIRALQHGSIFFTDPNTLMVRYLPLALADAGLPSWSPDGRFIVLYGASDILPFRQEDTDWWVAQAVNTTTPIKPVRTGIAAELRRIGVEPVLSPACWVGDKLYFSASSGEMVDLWEAQLSEATHRVEGTLRKVALGTGAVLNPTASRSGNIAFSMVSGDVTVWELPIEANLGVPAGPMERLTVGGPSFWSSVSRDGRQVAYSSWRFGSLDLYLKDVRTGGERKVASATEEPHISPDGSTIAFSRAEGGRAAIYVARTSGGEPSKVSADGGEVAGWSADGHSIIFDRGGHLHGHRLDLSTKKDSEFSRHAVDDSFLQSLSPDQHWVALNSGRRLYLAPVKDGMAAEAQQWLQITDGSDRVEQARWSPDGKLLYFISNRDQHRCIWMQRLAAATHKPEGSATAVAHFHNLVGPSMDYLAPEVVSLDVAVDKLVFVLGDFNSTVFSLSRQTDQK